MEITLNANDVFTVKLTGKTIVETMNGLAELPWHRANPAIEEIRAQIVESLKPKETTND